MQSDLPFDASSFIRVICYVSRLILPFVKFFIIQVFKLASRAKKVEQFLPLRKSNFLDCGKVKSICKDSCT